VEEAAEKNAVLIVYSESLPDAVINLSRSVNKLLLPMLKKDLLDTSEYYWLRGVYYPGEKIEMLYDILLKKGAKGLNVFLNLLQDTGKTIPRHLKHFNLMKSKLNSAIS